MEMQKSSENNEIREAQNENENTPVIPLPNPGEGGPVYPGPMFPGMGNGGIGNGGMGNGGIGNGGMANGGMGTPPNFSLPNIIGTIISTYPRPNEPCMFCNANSTRVGNVRFLNTAVEYLSLIHI